MQRKNGFVIFSLLDTPAFGGAEQYLFSHLSFLNSKGYVIVLATNNEVVRNEMLSRLTSKQKLTFHIIKAPYRLDAIGNWRGLVKFFLSLPKAILWCLIILRKLSKEYKKVICLWPGFSDRLVFSQLAKQFLCPLVWIEIGPLESTFKKNFGFPKLLYRFSERPDHIVTTSLFTKKSLVRNTKYSAKDITLIYPGTKLFSRKEINNFIKKATRWKKSHGLLNTTIISTVARLAAENELDVLIRAFSLYRMDNSDRTVKLLIVGDGPERNILQELSKNQNVDKSVVFCGFVSEGEKRIILASSRFFIFPRAWVLDGFGMTTIEAMSLGLPILTTNFGPQIEIITDGAEGYKYKPHDSNDLSLHIAQMMKLKTEKLQRMSNKSLRRVQVFSDDTSHNLMESVIMSVLSRYDKAY